MSSQSKTADLTATTNGHRRIDTVVIGGGQAGLTVGYYLKRQSRDFVILDDRQRVGDAWRTRWDSLVLFTPARYNGLPGLRFPGRGGAFTTKDQMADYLETYSERFGLPVRLGTRVENLTRHLGRFLVSTNNGTFEANNVVVAMTNFQVPKILPFAADLDPPIVQLHSKDYRNTSQLQASNVLVVGAGNSGAEIGIDVAKTHPTIMAGKESGHVPFRIEPFFGRNVLVRLVRFLGHHVLSVRTPIGRKVRPKLASMGHPLVRVKPKDLIRAGIERVGRITGVEGGLPVTEDGRVLEVANVIWCTGYRPGFSWIDLPIFGDRQEPIHERGVVSGEPGLYFVGLAFLYSATSETVTGQRRDAKRIARYLAKRAPITKSRATPLDERPRSGSRSNRQTATLTRNRDRKENADVRH